MTMKMVRFKSLMETITATRFNLITNDDYLFRHSSCLYLKNDFLNDTMKVIWRKKILEISPNKVMNNSVL